MSGSGAPRDSSGSARQIERERFELNAPGGLRIRGEALTVEGATTGVLLLHGFKGFYRWGFFPHVAERIAQVGLNVVSFNFSGSGVGDDLETFSELDAFANDTYTHQLDDIVQVVRESERKGWLGRTYGVFGHSRGGGIAVLHAARTDQVAALVTWASIADTQRWPREERERWRARGYLEVPNVRTGQILRLGTAILEEWEQLGATALDIEAAAKRMRAPWLIVHGTGDESVSFHEAERLSDVAPPSTTQLLLIEKASHTFDVSHPLVNSTPSLDRAVEHTTAFFRERLVDAAAGAPRIGG